MSRSDYVVVGLIAVGLLASSAIETQVPGFTLPPVAVFALSVLAKVIYPLLGVLPQLGVRVPKPPGSPDAALSTDPVSR